MNQPSAGAEKLAKEMNKRAAEHEDLICEGELQTMIDRHVAPLVEALTEWLAERKRKGYMVRDDTEPKVIAALQQWKDGKG